MAVFYIKNCISKAAHSKYLADCGQFGQLISVEITAKSMKLWVSRTYQMGEAHKNWISISKLNPRFFSGILVEP